MRERYTFAQQRCLGLAGKLMQQTEMSHPGAKIGVAVSGGVDSWVLLNVLHLRKRVVPFSYDIMALHINPGFNSANHAPLLEWLEKTGVAGHVEKSDHGPRAHSEENRRRSACFYCAMLRRKRLFELCNQYNLTHLAFGHNADDLASTFLMNLVQNGRVDGMRMKDSFFGGRLMVIRPLMLVDKSLIIKAAKAWNLPVWQGQCPSAGLTKRTDMENVVKNFCTIHSKAKVNIQNALIRFELEGLLGKQKPDDAPDNAPGAQGQTSVKRQENIAQG